MKCKVQVILQTQNEYEDVVDKVTEIDSNVSTLQSYTVSKGTNFGIAPDVFLELTSGTQNTAIAYGAGEGTYGLTTGSRNVMKNLSLNFLPNQNFPCPQNRPTY